MNGNSPESAGGLPNHVMDQLEQAAQQISARNRNHAQGGRGHTSQYRARGDGPGHQTLPVPGQQWSRSDFSQHSLPPSREDFPPLGSQHSVGPPLNERANPLPTRHSNRNQQGSLSRSTFLQQSSDPRQFPTRSPGAVRWNQQQPYRGKKPMEIPLPAYEAPAYEAHASNDFRRPAATHTGLYQHNAPSSTNSWADYENSGQELRLRVMAQSDYLNQLQTKARAKYQLKQEESRTKEDFRKRLETFFQRVLNEKYPEIDASHVRLKCYGSLNNGFGLAGCDMDLLLTLPEGFSLRGRTSAVLTPSLANGQICSLAEQKNHTFGTTASCSSNGFELGWLLEDALLDAEIGARLLTNTRVPIMKVCERPDPVLLHNLRQHAKEVRVPPSPKLVEDRPEVAVYPPMLDMKAIEYALSDLEDSDSAAQVSLPEDEQKISSASIEFAGDLGIKCDINFSNFVALCNTRLLKEYCEYDHRVAEVGVFVKTWAKIRDINTPYWGTLSSYGYVLMVLHYLMNVVRPPVIPNLQSLARQDDAWGDQSKIKLFEGKYDIRFWTDKEIISAHKSVSVKNRESTGHLLRGFFWYYSAREGFNYKYDVISIRTQGGILRKQNKGWTEAKWATENKHVRQRYLLAIEDPFETEHNVARVVGHNGIVAIRDEFRRAWEIVSRVNTPSALNVDLLEPVQNRGDLLRKDQEHHKHRMRQMKEDAEAKELQMREASLMNPSNAQETGTFKEDYKSTSFPPSMACRGHLAEKLLTRDVGTFQDKPGQSKHSRSRIVKEQNDDNQADADDEFDDKRHQPANERKSATTSRQPLSLGDKFDTHERATHGEDLDLCGPNESLQAHGFDTDDNLFTSDLSSHNGRWLRWRDRKVQRGRWRGVDRPSGRAVLNTVSPSESMRAHRQNPEGHKDLDQQRCPLPTTRSLAGMKDIALGPEIQAADALKSAWPETTTSGTTSVLEVDCFDPALNNRFPYDATTSRSQLSSYNEEQRRLHNHTIWPKAWRTVSDGLAKREAGNDVAETLSTNPFKAGKASISPQGRLEKVNEFPSSLSLHRTMTLGQHLDVDTQSRDRVSPEDRTIHTIKDKGLDTALIRNRRLAFFASQASTTSEVQDLERDQEVNNNQQVMMKAVIKKNELTVPRNNHAVLGTSPKANKDLVLNLVERQEHQWSNSNGPWTSEVAEVEEPGTQLSVSFINSSDRRLSASQHANQLTTSKSPNTVSEIFVNEASPRQANAADAHNSELGHGQYRPDEDPMIMPIPRNLSFVFDTRQLHDLAVIREGGNACARDGYQFEVEEDYELGGSGAMAWKLSSVAVTTSHRKETDEVYEYGKGDEEGLLNELPTL